MVKQILKYHKINDFLPQRKSLETNIASIKVTVGMVFMKGWMNLHFITCTNEHKHV